MQDINLLPWRAERRRIRDRRMLAASLCIWLLCASSISTGYGYLKIMQDNQRTRNDYLEAELKELDRKIGEIEKLQVEKNDLIFRMEAIRRLKRERRLMVHLFDDLARKLPEGVYFSAMSKQGRSFSLRGAARSNDQVSELMNRLKASEWFANPDLSVINVAPSDGLRLSEFQLTVSEKEK